MSALRRNSRNKLQRYQIAVDLPLDDPQEYPTSRMGQQIQNKIFKPVAQSMSQSKAQKLGYIIEKQTYLSTLQEEIEMLRSKIAKMEAEDSQKIAKRSLVHHQEGQLSDVPSQEGRKSLSRKSQAGRIYVRASTPSSSKKTLLGSGKQQKSSFYKWRPQVEERQRAVSDFQTQAHGGKMAYANTSPQMKNRPITNYRVKHKNTKSIVQQKLAPPIEDKRQVKKKFKTEKLLSDNQEENELVSPSKKDQSVNKEGLSHPAQQLKVQPEQPEQLKNVFVFTPDMQIMSINDDFRTKIINKLQIPNNFPMDPPKPTQALQQLQKRSFQIYKLFNINLSKCTQNLVVRKFKNGVYFQLKPNKNIVWYFTGAFYFGDWDTDLPSQAEKDGFGFQYIPDKYYYLGNFKNGTRNGKGTIKLINPSNPTDRDTLAYDGEWLNGKPHGKGCQIDERDNKYLGQFQHGQKTGKAVILNHDGLCYEGELRQGLKHGKGTQKLLNGDVYIGDFVLGLFQGVGTYTWKNGSVYTGQFSNGKREGKGLWKSYNGDQFQGNYSNDLKNGWGKFTWKNGQIYEGEFKDDIRNGVGSYRHPNGKIGTYFWIDGHIDHKIQKEQSSSSKLQQVSTNIQSPQ